LIAAQHETISKLCEVQSNNYHPIAKRETVSQTILAEGILKSAADGERNPQRLRDAALMAVSA